MKKVKLIGRVIRVFFIGGYQLSKAYYKEPKVLQVGFIQLMESMFAFALEAKTADTPLMTKWVIGEDDNHDELLVIWAAKGDTHPLKRIEELRDERNALKAELEALKSLNP